MKLLELVSKVTQYLSEAADRIFRPRQDDYPKTGIQPFTGDPTEEPKWG
jgi:hypothetical protein